VVIAEGLDFGDAPDLPYPTVLASNGARHIAVGPMMGALRDTELDGQPNATATGDDLAVSDDEDGVTFTPPGSVTVNASAVCTLNAWMDLNGDGDWADAGEQIFVNRPLVAGNNVLALPAGAKQSLMFSRWRVNSTGNLTYTGQADDGEVEDYATECMKNTHPDYTNFSYWNKPKCWCYPRQCRGDADGLKLSVFWVSANDLALLRLSIGKLEAQIPPGGICCDFDHKKLSVFWVSANDLAILRLYIGKLEAQIPVCDNTHINFWCSP